MNEYCSIAPDVKLGKGVKLSKFINLYGCEIGDDTKIGAFVEIQKNASVGRRCKISSHTFICEGVTIEDDVFIGHNVSFINDRYPRATANDGNCKPEADWKVSIAPSSRTERRSARAPRFSPTSPSEKMPSSARAASSPRTFPQIASSAEIRQGCSARSNPQWRP